MVLPREATLKCLVTGESIGRVLTIDVRGGGSCHRTAALDCGAPLILVSSRS
jgi:hypothetical protein